MKDSVINVKTKGLSDFLSEDKSLTDTFSYEEFCEKKAAPNNSDDILEDVYRAYRTALEKL